MCPKNMNKFGPSHSPGETRGAQSWFPSPALWDTALNFDAGDTVTICGPNFNVMFASTDNVSGSAGLTLHGTAPGHVKVSVTFGGTSIAAALAGHREEASKSASHDGDADDRSYLMNEPNVQYAIVRRPIRSVVIPSGIKLTPRLLLSALMQLPTSDIEHTIEHLIDVVNGRCGNSDDEPSTDEEPEPEQRDRPVQTRI